MDAQAKQFFLEGIKEHHLLNWNNSIRKFRRAISYNPDNNEIIAWLCISLLTRDQRNSEEISSLIQPITKCSIPVCSLAKGIYLSTVKNQHVKGIEFFDFALKNDPKFGYAYIMRSLANVKLGNGANALTDLEQALSIEQSPYNLYMSAAVKSQLGHKESAIEDISLAIEKNKKFYNALRLRADVFKSTGRYELAIADQVRFIEQNGILREKFETAEDQEKFDAVHEIFTNSILPDLKKNDERLIDFWITNLFWGTNRDDRKKGNRTEDRLSKNQGGYFGFGFICLTDRFLRIYSIGKLSAKYAKDVGLGLATHLSFLVLNSHDTLIKTERRDRFWQVSFRDINEVRQNEDVLEIVSNSETWQARLWLGESDLLQTALDLARTGNLRKTIGLGALRIRPSKSQSSNEILDTIDQLKESRDKGSITDEEFKHLKSELLSRL